MIVNTATLQALRVGYKTEFQDAFDAVPQLKDKVAKTIRSSTALNTYGWLKGLSGLREWLGPRQIDNLSEASYTLLNKHFEKTIAVNRNNIEDDNLGMYSDGFSMMGDGAARLPEELVWGLLKSGFTTNCWDNQFFFDTDHPAMLADGSMGIRRYDSAGTLFYLDPPYWGCEGDYGKHLFARKDFQRLAEVLTGVKGRFILSLNDVEGVRETFKTFRFRAVKTTYTIGSGPAQPDRAEVLISNYDLGEI